MSDGKEVEQRGKKHDLPKEVEEPGLQKKPCLEGARDVNDNTISSIVKLRYRIVSISKRNENVQKCKTLIESKIEGFERNKFSLLIKQKRIIDKQRPKKVMLIICWTN